MQITADVALKGPIWAEMLDLLVDEYLPGIGTYML